MSLTSRLLVDARSLGLMLVVAACLVPGDLRAQAVSIAALDGASVVPPTPSTGAGGASVWTDEDVLVVDLSFAALLGMSTASHLHCCAAAPATSAVAVSFPSFPTGVTGAIYSHTFDLTLAATYQPAFMTQSGGTPATAKAALLAGMRDGQAYTCVHTAIFPGSEIRGYLAFASFADGFESADLLDWSLATP